MWHIGGCVLGGQDEERPRYWSAPVADCGLHLGGPDRMIKRAEQANIVGHRSKDFVQWVEENIDAPIKRGPGGAILERLKAGLVGEFFNWAKRNSTWLLHFDIM